MEPQADIVRYIDSASTKAAAQLSGEPKPGKFEMVFSLVFPPAARFASEFIFKGGVLRGVDGLRAAVNAWALSFAIQAKRYEKHYADNTALNAKARDFLD